MVIKKVCCIGAGLTGGTFSTVVALKCPEIEVHVLDENKEKVDLWNSDNIPVFEPNVEDIVKTCRNRNLLFTSDVTTLRTADVIFICTEAYMTFQKAAEMKALEDATRLILSTVDSSKIIVEKSTVAIRASKMMRHILKAHEEPSRTFTLISNPEFLTEGCILSRLLKPDRVLIGGENTTQNAEAVESIIWIYEHWVPRSKIVTSDMWTAEMLNIAEAAFLAQRVTTINCLSEVCEISNIDLNQVAQVIEMDPRIGAKKMEKCIGFRGFHFRKSLQGIIYLCKYLRLGEVATYWQKMLDINNYQKHRFVRKIIEVFSNTVLNRCMAVLGFSSKKYTACTEDSAAVYICKVLLQEGVTLRICDPVVPADVIMKDLTNVLEGTPLVEGLPKLVETFNDPYEAVRGTQGVILCTAWPQFVKLNFDRVFDVMIKPAYVFDGNKVLPYKTLEDIGFQVQGFGKNPTSTVTTANFH